MLFRRHVERQQMLESDQCASQTLEYVMTAGYQHRSTVWQCHYSYNDCALGSDGTDRLVELVQEIQHKNSAQGGKGTLFGAKITGGGSGGSVCVIGRNCVKSSEQILEIQGRYKAATGYLPYVFEGSSPGAGTFGYLKLRRQLLR